MVVADSGLSRLRLATMSLYEEYLTRLICIRNELECLRASRPPGKGYFPLPFSISFTHDVERTMSALRLILSNFHHHAQDCTGKSWQPADPLDLEMTSRPPGLPMLPADDGLIQRLLKQVEELLIDLCPSPDALS